MIPQVEYARTIEGLEAEIEQLTQDNERITDIVYLLLPLAKGYVSHNCIQSNIDIINATEKALSLQKDGE